MEMRVPSKNEEMGPIYSPPPSPSFSIRSALSVCSSAGVAEVQSYKLSDYNQLVDAQYLGKRRGSQVLCSHYTSDDGAKCN